MFFISGLLRVAKLKSYNYTGLGDLSNLFGGVTSVRGMPLSKLRPCPLFQNVLLVSKDADLVQCRMPSRNRGR